jgi:hypothetical protein
LHLQPLVGYFPVLPSMLDLPAVAQPANRIAATIIHDNTLMYFIFFRLPSSENESNRSLWKNRSPLDTLFDFMC